MATQAVQLTEGQETTLRDLSDGGGDFAAVDEFDKRSINALSRRGLVLVKERKTGTMVKISKAGKKFLN